MCPPSEPSTTPTPAPFIGPRRLIVRAAPAARVRSAPSRQGGLLRSLPSGTIVLVDYILGNGEAVPVPAVAGVDPRGDTSRAWAHLIYPVDGYVFEPLLGELPDGAAVYSEHSPILAPAPDDPIALATAFTSACRRRGTPYRDDEVRAIGYEYALRCAAAGVDAAPVLAQVVHETGGLSAFWSLPPQCNPAGIGVTGEHAPGAPNGARPGPGWSYNHQRRRWERGITFTRWTQAMRAHIGRLLAYALPPGTGTPPQQALVVEALSWRDFPLIGRGTATTWRQLGRAHNPQGGRGIGWAAPGKDYGERIAVQANALIWGGAV